MKYIYCWYNDGPYLLVILINVKIPPKTMYPLVFKMMMSDENKSLNSSMVIDVKLFGLKNVIP